MATSYTIVANRSQDIGLNYDYDTHADKLLYPTKESWLQYKNNVMVLDPMYAAQQASSIANFEASFETIPEAEQPAASAEIEAVIVAHGGEIVTAGDSTNPNNTRGIVQAPRGTSSNPIQVGGTNKEPPDTSGPNGRGDNETETRD